MYPIARVSTPRRGVLAAAAASALLLVAGSAGRAATDPPAALKAILEVDRDAYYAGDAVPIRLSIWNDGTAPLDGPAGSLEAGFDLRDADGNKVAPVTASDPPSGAGSQSLRPGAFIGLARDLGGLFPRLKQAGTYRLQWSGNGLTSNALILKVVPRYDPEKDYTARLETDAGSFTIELFRKDAPLATKAFVELAMSGFYDGILFHYVEPGRLVVSGDPTGTGRGGPGFGLPVERTKVKLLAGTVLMKPAGQPAANGSTFMILLAPRPDFEGTYTGFGQVVDGLDVVNRISQAPASPKTAPYPHRPLKDVKLNRVVITANPPKGA